LTQNAPIFEILQEESGFDVDRITTQVPQHPECIALSVREDLELVLRVMSNITDEIHFLKFDKIQIYRGGLDILSITFKGNNCGRSVYLEINDYRRRLHQLLRPTAERQIHLTALSTAACTIVGTFAVQNFCRSDPRVV
jgi:hypothetical protein